VSASDSPKPPPHAGRPPLPPIDFRAINDAIAGNASYWVQQWLPNGQERNQRWYIGDFDNSPGESANVNLRTGQFIDNGAPDDKGGDFIALYARVKGLGQGEAALELGRALGIIRPRPEPATAPRAPAARASHPSGSAPAASEAPAPAARPAGPTAAPADTAPDAEPPPWHDEAGLEADDGPAPPAAAPGAAQPAPLPAAAPRPERWVPVVPAPTHAPVPRMVWRYKDKRRGIEVTLEPVRHWAYWRDGALLGYVARYERTNSKGETVKDTIPWTWCRDTQDPHQGHRWHAKTWTAPRPLYLPRGTLRPHLPLVVVEGEKCADALDALLGDELDAVAWPGGGKTWQMAAWDWVAGRAQVTLWPDADAQRERLTADEKLAQTDPDTKPVLPLHKQPGWHTMQGLAMALLARDARTQVRMCHIGEPGKTYPPGWDVADAIAEGWSAERVRQFIADAPAFVHPDDAARAALAPLGSLDERLRQGDKPPPPKSWTELLLRTEKGAVKAVRDNLVIALDGQVVDGVHVPGAPECAGVIAFNEFTNDVIKLKPVPWGTGAGVWDEVDELEMGNYLTRTHWLPSMPRGTLEEAVAMVAKRHRYHPVRAEFEALRGRWDGTARLKKWLRICCLEEDEWDDTQDNAPVREWRHWGERMLLQQYLARAGKWFVMAMVARVMTPGCKFDNMLILEGPQGVRKSTVARVLGGKYFADTGLVLGDKDSYQNLQGVSVYEWGELDSLTKAEVTKVKQFISSSTDRFRASFDRRPRDYPRQCVFLGTTNEDQYLVDPTGNRRFWPVRVSRVVIDTDWLRDNRDQMIAEALVCLDAGERFYPDAAEQKILFEPQQERRQVDNSIHTSVMRYLYDEQAKFKGAIDNGTLVNEISASELLLRIGIDIDKQTHQVVRQATAALRSAGWERERSSRGDRPWVFKRPKDRAARAGLPGPSNTPAPGTMEEGALVDDCPF
jgi:putative DNA primase/helicase